MESQTLETRLGPLSYRSSGDGPTLVFFAGALANGDLWRDVVAALEDRYRCITIDLPLGAHPHPLFQGADRSATSLARLELDCLDLLDVEDATVVANDTAGGLLLLSLATEHPALDRIGRLVLTNCESYDKFPPDALKRAASVSRNLPRLARALVGLQARSSAARRKIVASVAAQGLDPERTESFFGPARRDPQVAGDLVAAMARLPSAAAPRCRRGDPALRPAGAARLGRLVRVLPGTAMRSDSRPTSRTRRCTSCRERRRGSRSTRRPQSWMRSSRSPRRRCGDVSGRSRTSCARSAGRSARLRDCRTRATRTSDIALARAAPAHRGTSSGGGAAGGSPSATQ